MTDNGHVTGNALDLIRAAHTALDSDYSVSFDRRFSAAHLLYNVTDHVLGLMTNAYVSPAFKAAHARYSAEWREKLNIRTCDDCGTYMHDRYGVPCESPIGDVFVFCETCAVFNGFAEVCPHCTLAYAHADMMTYVTVRVTDNAYGLCIRTYDAPRACVDCFPTLHSDAPTSTPTTDPA